MADEEAMAEVVEVVGRTGMHGEAIQVKCKVLDGHNKGRMITRNVLGRVKVGDILILMESSREARKLSVK